MAIEVRIPTSLRTYTDGAKAVEGQGDTLADLFTDLESRHTGIRALFHKWRSGRDGKNGVPRGNGDLDSAKRTTRAFQG